MKEKMNIFKQYFYAVTNPKKYSEMTRLGGGRVFLYLLLLAVVTTIVSMAGPVISYFQMGGATEIVDTYIPEFSLKNGAFTTNMKYNDTFDMEDLVYADEATISQTFSSDGAEEIRPYIFYILAKEFSLVDGDYTQLQSQQIAQELAAEISDAKFYLFLDTSVGTISEAIKNGDISTDNIKADDVIIITKHDFTFLSADEFLDTADNGELTTYTYGDSEDINISKSEILDVVREILPVLYAFFGIFVIIFIFISIIGWLFAGLIYSIIALIANSIFKKQLPYGVLFKTAVYAQTTTIILKAVLGYFTLPGAVLTYGGYLITIIYIILAIKFDEDMNIPYNNGYPNNDPNGYTQYQYGSQPQNDGYNNGYNNNGYNPDNSGNSYQNNNENPSPNDDTNSSQNNNDGWTNV